MFKLNRFIILFLFIVIYCFSCKKNNIIKDSKNNNYSHIPTTSFTLHKSLNNKLDTPAPLYSKGVKLYSQNKLKKAKEVMEKAKILAELYDSSWEYPINTQLRFIYYAINDFRKLYYLEKNFGETTPFINFLYKLNDINVYEIKTFSKTVTVPINNSDGNLSIPVSINGKGEEFFLVDTASNISIISSEIAEKYNITTIEEGTIYANPQIQPLKVKYAKIDALQIGDITIYNVPVTIIDNKTLTWNKFGIFTYFKIDGIIGLPIISKFKTTIDFPNNTFSLSTDKSNLKTDNGYDFFLSNNFIYTQIEINGVKNLNFCIDTAGEMTEIYGIGIDKIKKSSIYLKIEKSKDLTVETIYGEKNTFGMFYPDNFIINDYSLKKIPLLISYGSLPKLLLEEHGNLGLNILKQFKITLDFNNMKMYLEIP